MVSANLSLLAPLALGLLAAASPQPFFPRRHLERDCDSSVPHVHTTTRTYVRPTRTRTSTLVEIATATKTDIETLTRPAQTYTRTVTDVDTPPPRTVTLVATRTQVEIRTTTATETTTRTQARTVTAYPTFSSGIVAVPMPTGQNNSTGGGGACSTGPVQCCNQVADSQDPQMTTILSSLGIDLSSVTGMVATDCSPLNVAAIGGGADCEQHPVCCSDNTYQGLINIGCMPIDLHL